MTGTSLDCKNSAPTPITCTLTLTLSYSKTNTFTFTANQSITLGYKSSVKVGLPGVGEGTAEWSITGTAGFSQGKSDAETETKTFAAQVAVPTPAKTTYKAYLVGSQVQATIPYVYTGIATFKSEKTAKLVNVPGVYDGVDTGLFSAEVVCVQSPEGCPSGVLQTRPVASRRADLP